MKTKHIFGVVASLLGILLLTLVLANFYTPDIHAQNSVTNLLLKLPTPTPQGADASEIGSTDGILVMGIVIVLIVTMPLIFHKKN